MEHVEEYCHTQACQQMKLAHINTVIAAIKPARRFDTSRMKLAASRTVSRIIRSMRRSAAFLSPMLESIRYCLALAARRWCILFKVGRRIGGFARRRRLAAYCIGAMAYPLARADDRVRPAVRAAIHAGRFRR